MLFPLPEVLLRLGVRFTVLIATRNVVWGRAGGVAGISVRCSWEVDVRVAAQRAALWLRLKQRIGALRDLWFFGGSSCINYCGSDAGVQLAA